MRLTPSLALAATLILGSVGCVGLGTVSKIDVSNLASGSQSVKLKSDVTDSRDPAATGFTPWSRKDIQRIVIDLYELSGQAESIVFRIDASSTSPYSRTLSSEDLGGSSPRTWCNFIRRSFLGACYATSAIECGAGSIVWVPSITLRFM